MFLHLFKIELFFEKATGYEGHNRRSSQSEINVFDIYLKEVGKYFYDERSHYGATDIGGHSQ